MRGMLIGVAVAAVSGGIVLAQQDFSQVQIKTTKIGGNFYTLEGSGRHDRRRSPGPTAC